MSTRKISPKTTFAYWVPNVSGGLVTSTIEQRTSWDYDYNVKLAQTAENNGFDYALNQVRYQANYGASFQQEPTAFSLALLLATERLNVITAVLPALWNPGVLAKIATTADNISKQRFSLNFVSGWFKDEYHALGLPWLEHDERYRQTGEFIDAIRATFTDDVANFSGDFFRLHDYRLQPKPEATVERPHPEIFQGGNSTASLELAGRVADWYLSNGKQHDGVTEQLTSLTNSAERHNREVKFGVNSFIIARDTEKEAEETLREIISKADKTAVLQFADSVKQAGQSTIDKKGMWADSSLEDLVQYNDGFRTGLIGTPEQIAERIDELRRLGVDLVLSGFLHYQEEVEYFGKKVLPLVRELEAADKGALVTAGAE